MSDQKSQKGIFITLEGADGVGKTTQAKLIAQKIAVKVHEETEVLQMREPGGTPICEEIRNILKTSKFLSPICELMLFNAARSQLVEEVIRPTTDAGGIVVCDRFLDSTIAYQHCGNGIPWSTVNSIIQTAIAGKVPDITIMLQLNEEEANIRANKKGITRDGLVKYDTSTLEYKRRVAEGFLNQAKLNPNRIKIVSAEGTEDEVCERIWEILEPILDAANLLLRPTVGNDRS